MNNFSLMLYCLVFSPLSQEELVHKLLFRLLAKNISISFILSLNQIGSRDGHNFERHIGGVLKILNCDLLRLVDLDVIKDINIIASINGLRYGNLE
jgi:hypothetical protein